MVHHLPVSDSHPVVSVSATALLQCKRSQKTDNVVRYLELLVGDAGLEVARAQPLQGGLPHLHVAGVPQLRRGLASLQRVSRSGEEGSQDRTQETREG
jgi:hypothetical protein